jgi:hypothetical protein
MMTRYIALVALTLTVAACASSNTPTEPVVYSQAEAADSVSIRVGQTALVGGLKIRFHAVESDSRCPSDVVCVWAGDAIANFVVEQNCECRSVAYDMLLHSTLQPKSGVAYGYRVELLHLAPYPVSTSSIKPDAYTAWLRIVPVEG